MAKCKMADGDSWTQEMNNSSDVELDTSAADADVDDDEVASASGQDTAVRKKNKKKKRGKGHEMHKSSGDSDSQPNAGEDQEQEEVVAEGKDSAQDIQDPSKNGDIQNEDVKIQQLQKAMELLRLPQPAPKSMEDARRKQYQFWDTQPVPKLDEDIRTHGPIEPDKSVEEIRKEPYSLPPGFSWDSLDIDNPAVLKEIYTLLNENYVEDDDNMFRFDYSPDFLHWALQPPGWLREWHIGVRVIKSNKLIGFISGVPAHIRVYEHKQKMVEINFLCVHKKLRSKRVAPVLIREVTRRVNCHGIFQAVYTAGVVLPKPVSSCRYWHRSLNPRKLIDVKFSHLSRNMTMQRTLKLYRLPEEPKISGLRLMGENDLSQAFKLVSEYLKLFDLVPVFTEEEFRHWFVPRPGIVDSYVVERDGQITDFLSFYTLPSTVMHHPVHKSLKAAYAFYNVSTKTPWADLMQDALIIAKNMGFDVFNALDLMDNKQFLEKLKFGIGDGNLQYYLYNWKCPTMQPDKVGLVLQ